jgi:SET domain-containing protein
MLTIKTYITQSNIHGLGLFAGEDIKKGVITWKFHPILDIRMSQEQFNQLPQHVRDFVSEFGSLSLISNMYILSADNTRFTNHSDQPNLDTIIMDNEPEAVGIANCDIALGEEMTINYKSFDRLSINFEKDYLK